MHPGPKVHSKRHKKMPVSWKGHLEGWKLQFDGLKGLMV